MVKKKVILIKSEVMESAWDEMRETFDSVEDEIKKLIARWEKERNVEVLSLAMVGTVGVWNGNFTGGKEVKAGNILESSNYDDLEVYFNTEGQLEFKFMHHDGSHYMNLYLITERRLDAQGLDYDLDTWDARDFGKIHASYNPLKDDGEFNPGWELYSK